MALALTSPRTLGLVLAVAASLAASSVSAATVVALGASNTEGRGRGAHPDGVPKSQAYPAQLQAMLAAQGCKASVLNAGVAGDTTAGMLRRAPRVIGKDTKVLILQPGGNDARQGVAGTQDNIAAIRALAESRGVKVVMLESLRVASAYRLPDGMHYSAPGHKLFAESVLSDVASAACGR